MTHWKETLITITLGAIVVPPLLVLLLWLVGGAIETVAKHSEEHDRCLKQATNGYEIRQCR